MVFDNSAMNTIIKKSTKTTKENVLKTLITDLQGEEAMKQQGEETTHICLNVTIRHNQSHSWEA